MSAAHTAGPWNAAGTPPKFRVMADGSPVAEAFGESAHEALANARLIAAAPELYSLLIEAVAASGFSLSGPTDWRVAEHGEPAWVCKARAAIAKATGG
jgi:hypothetical protein